MIGADAIALLSLPYFPICLDLVLDITTLPPIRPSVCPSVHPSTQGRTPELESPGKCPSPDAITGIRPLSRDPSETYQTAPTVLIQSARLETNKKGEEEKEEEEEEEMPSIC